MKYIAYAALCVQRTVVVFSMDWWFCRLMISSKYNTFSHARHFFFCRICFRPPMCQMAQLKLDLWTLFLLPGSGAKPIGRICRDALECNEPLTFQRIPSLGKVGTQKWIQLCFLTLTELASLIPYAASLRYTILTESSRNPHTSLRNPYGILTESLHITPHGILTLFGCPWFVAAVLSLALSPELKLLSESDQWVTMLRNARHALRCWWYSQYSLATVRNSPFRGATRWSNPCGSW